MVEALDRLQKFRELSVNGLQLAHVPPGRLKVLARYAAAVKAQSITRMQKDRRIATLLAFARIYETVAQDDAVDLLNQLISESLRKADQKGAAERLTTIPELDRAALRLRDAVRIVLDDKQPDLALRAAIFALVSREQLEEDVHTVDNQTRGEDETHYYEHLVNHYSQMRRFLPMLLERVDFRGSAAAEPVLKALAFLRRREGKQEVPMEKAPREVITKNWQKLVLPENVPDQRFYTLCTLQRLQDGLHRRDIFLAESERWGDPRAKLLQGRRGARLGRPSAGHSAGKPVARRS